MKKQQTTLTGKYAAGLLLALLVCCQTRADYLPNNFWPNSSFESGANLDAADGSGTPTGWTRFPANANVDPTICQVLNSNSVSPSHSLAVIDNGFYYGEWDSTVVLAGHASPGDSVTVQWYELYSISSGEMRVTVSFFDANTNSVGVTHSVVTGDSSGWSGDLASSTFTKRSETLAVPVGATQMQVALISGGSAGAQGVMLIDDLSVAPQPNPRLLSGNFWPNPSFELGTGLNTPTGTPSGWNRSGTDTTIDQVTTNNYVSSGHALAEVDASSANYGTWYSDQVSIVGHANPGDVLNLQWFELYSITGGSMRMVFTFYNASGTDVGDTFFNVTGNSAGWQGSLTNGGFTQRNQQLTVPANAAKLMVQLVSRTGTTTTATGIYVIDDLSVATPPGPSILSGNFWPNPTFESGSNLNGTNGVPTGWIATGGDTSICQMTTNGYTSATHALAVVDVNGANYGEWDADVWLGTNASPGDALNLQWSEVYAITNDTMRLTVIFFDANTNLLTQTDLISSGNSAGWAGQIAGSSFAPRKLQVLIPYNAAILRISLVSGGLPASTGIYVIDDLSVARVPYPSTILSYNLIPNPTFEDGAQLDSPTVGIPAGGWQRGGGFTLDQVLTNNSVSTTHALAVVDNNAGNYGEWYLNINTAGILKDNDALDIQWYEMFNVSANSGDQMRLTVYYLDASGNQLPNHNDFLATNSSPGWTGTMATSPFQHRFERAVVQPGTQAISIHLASGGSSAVTGFMMIDDLSMRLSLPQITSIAPQIDGYKVTWNSMASKSYTVLYSATLGAGVSWSMIATDVPGAGLTTSYLDTTAHLGTSGFYRIIQQ